MITVKEAVGVVKQIIIGNRNVVSSITYKGNLQPEYGANCPKICKMGLSVCNKFYRDLEEDSTRLCPFGFKVKHTVKLLSNLEDTIYLHSIVENTNDLRRGESFRSQIGRKQKIEFDIAVQEAKSFTIQNDKSIGFHDLLIRTLETLLLGRISNAMQALAHQIFTPLQGGMSDLENILEFDRFHNTPSVRRLKKNLENINGIAQQVQMLLSTTSEFTPNMIRKVVVHDVVNKVIERLESAAADKFVVIHQRFNHHGKVVEAIPYQFEIVIDNLIENAVKYSFTGSPDRKLFISINYEEEDGYLLISVRNQGVGITELEIRERLIFELGYRGENSQDRQRRGTGSGLFIANRIINMHNGRIDVTCTLSEGEYLGQGERRYETTFIIKMPYYYEDELALQRL